MTKSKTIKKVYNIRADREEKGKYLNDAAHFTVLAENISEALEKAESKIKSVGENAVIGKIEMLHVIS